MKTRPKFRLIALFAVTVTSAFSVAQAASVISVNFAGDARGPDYEYTVSSTAGVVPAGSWNNYYLPGLINVENNGLYQNLLDNSGAGTGTYINYTSGPAQSTWGLGQPVATISNDNSGLYNNFLNYFYHGEIYIGQLTEQFTSSGYKVIVYFADADAGWQNYTLTEIGGVTNDSTTLYGRTNGAGVYANSPFGGFVGSTATTPESALASNYVVFDGVDAPGFRITGFGEYVTPEGGGDYYTRPAIVGFQIVAVPEPGTVGLALFAAGAGFVFLRRRQA